MNSKPTLDHWLSGLIIADQATSKCDSEDKPLIATMLKIRKRLIFNHQINRRDTTREFALSIVAHVEMHEGLVDRDERLMWMGISNGDDTVVLIERGQPQNLTYTLYASGPRGTEVLLPLAAMVI